MSRFQSLLFACLFLVGGCTGRSGPESRDGAILIEQGPSQTELRFWKHSWGGIVGVHGYVGYVTYSCAAALDGSGPIFRNPKFLDNPPDFRCVGTITLDRRRNEVIVEMRRLISKPGEPEQGKAHPANGKYRIESVRKATVPERDSFSKWEAQPSSLRE